MRKPYPDGSVAAAGVPLDRDNAPPEPVPARWQTLPGDDPTGEAHVRSMFSSLAASHWQTLEFTRRRKSPNGHPSGLSHSVQACVAPRSELRGIASAHINTRHRISQSRD